MLQRKREQQAFRGINIQTHVNCSVQDTYLLIYRFLLSIIDVVCVVLTQ